MITKYMKRSSILCLILGFVTPLTTLSSQRAEFGPWSIPMNAGLVINSERDDAAPVVIDHGRTIYFSSNRTGSIKGSEDIWVATRKHERAEWSAPRPVSILNTSSVERLRSISPDGRLLVFQSNRDGGLGGFDIWVSTRKNKNDDSGWSAPVNLGTLINSDSNEIAGNYVFGSRGQELFISSSRSDIGGLGEGDIYVSEIPEGRQFGPLVNVTELNSPFVETCFWVRQDSLEIIFSSTRGRANNDPTSFDLWRSTRETESDTWSTPVNLGPRVNADDFQDVNPFVSEDGTTLWFSSRRPNSNGPTGNMDIYVSTRIRLH